jgi:drug/metabolite transporter (DMT)-like permease
MVVAALCFTPIALSEVQHHTWGNVSWEAWIGLVYRATAGMVVAMALWGKALHRLGPTQMMVYAYLEPVSAVVLAASVLERIPAPHPSGGCRAHPWRGWARLLPIVGD